MTNSVCWTLHIHDHNVIKLQLESERWKKCGRRKCEIKFGHNPFLWETPHQRPIKVLQFNYTMPWRQDHLGVRGKSIATAALGCVSARLESQKRTSVLQVKRYRAVKGKPLMLTNLKAQGNICSFHFSVGNVIFLWFWRTRKVRPFCR